MREDKQYVVIKSIPICGGKYIPVNSEISRIHGVFYLNGVILTNDYQEDFNLLIDSEEKDGWKYLSPIKQKVVFTNEKEDA